MIDKSLLIPPQAALMFQVSQIFWAYVFPVFMGFFSVMLIQIYSRIGTMRNIKMRTAFLCAGLSAMVNLWGWTHVARTPALIPFYGCGVGLCAAVMSRVFAIVQKQRTPWKVRVPHVIWKGNVTEIQAFQERLKKAA